MKRGVVACGVVAAALLVCGLGTDARAYPQFQFTTGATRCTLCHYAPAGGGLINGYGRDESADTISRGGKGDFLHGWWKPPEWVKLGGDYRFVSLINDPGGADAPELVFFPMQTDLYTRVELMKKRLSVNFIAGWRGSARPRDPSLLSRFVSREHYVMWRPKSIGWYARAGRFMMPYGLRLPDHNSYTRRYLGLHSLEETYNVGVGSVQNDWEVHVTAFTPDFLRPVGHLGSGLAVFAERRLDSRTAFGFQAKASVAEHDGRYTMGVTGKRSYRDDKLLLMGELDVIRQEIDDVPEGRTELVGHLQAAYWLKKGWLASLSAERYDEDVSQPDVARDSFTASVQWFPRAHFELQLLARERIIGGGDGGDPQHLALLMLHYYP